MKDELLNHTEPKYRFKKPHSLIFLTGVPLSGKSTIAPLVVSSIEGCSLQPMDILRIMSQEIEAMKPIETRDKFVRYGSCDSYKLIEDGTYSEERLITGFNLYANAVSSLLVKILPKLEQQGVRDLMFEGVQLTPGIIVPIMPENARLIILTSDVQQLGKNLQKMFSGNDELLSRYSTDKLILLQNELIRQMMQSGNNSVKCIDNTGDYLESASNLIKFLLDTGLIEKK